MLSLVHDVIMNFDDLLNAPRPTTSVNVAGHDLELRAITAEDLDDMITRYPAPAAKKKEQAFSDELRYELVSRTVSNVELSTDQVKELFKAWGRADVSKLQGKVFQLNWVGNEDDAAPLSESESDKTSDTR